MARSLADKLRRDRELRAAAGLDEYLTLTEAATLLRCSESFLRHSPVNGGRAVPPSVKVGSRRIFRRSDIEAWVTAQLEDQRDQEPTQ